MTWSQISKMQGKVCSFRCPHRSSGELALHWEQKQQPEGTAAQDGLEGKSLLFGDTHGGAGTKEPALPGHTWRRSAALSQRDTVKKATES